MMKSVPMLAALPLPGADLRFAPGFLAIDEADALFDALRGQVPWAVHRVRLFGRSIDSPRLSCWIGDPEARYRYSGVRHEPQPWPPVLQPLRRRLHDVAGTDFNSVLANLYRDGSDAMGWHSDDEAGLGGQPVIASLSLGATRRFALKARRRSEHRFSLELPHGSLLLMAGDTQHNWRHALPRTRKRVGVRINLTFRRIVPSG